MSLRKRGMKNLGNFDTKAKKRMHKSTKSGTGDLTPMALKYGMTKKWWVMVGLPVKGVISGSVGS